MASNQPTIPTLPRGADWRGLAPFDGGFGPRKWCRAPHLAKLACVSEYESARRTVKALKLSNAQARSVAERAFRADLAAGLPHLALKCARDFELGDDRVNAAASALVTLLLDKKRYSDALEVARGFNLADGESNVQSKLIEDARRIDLAALDDVQKATVTEIKKLAGAAVNKRSRSASADEALEAIAAATAARAGDPRVKGRVVFLPSEGDLYLTGDLHGSVENLRRFAATADLDNHPERILVIQEIVHSRIITADQRDLSFVAIFEALQLMARYPKRVYYLLGNHDLAFALGRELVKGGKFLNRFLYKGLAYMYQARHEEVAEAYKKFILDMPVAIHAPHGILMTHSTPKRPFIPSLSMEYLTTTSVKKHLSECGPIKALVEGRDFEEPTIQQFTERMGVSLVVNGHTPTKQGFRVANSRQLIIDSQHENGRWVRFDLGRPYTMDELKAEVQPLVPENSSSDIVVELM